MQTVFDSGYCLWTLRVLDVGLLKDVKGRFRRAVSRVRRRIALPLLFQASPEPVHRHASATQNELLTCRNFIANLAIARRCGANMPTTLEATTTSSKTAVSHLERLQTQVA